MRVLKVHARADAKLRPDFPWPYDFLYSTFDLSKLVIDFSVIDPGICMIQFPGWTYIIHSTINSTQGNFVS